MNITHNQVTQVYIQMEGYCRESRVHLGVDVEDVGTFKLLALRLWVVEQESFFHSEEPADIHQQV